jgi:hypothetical protein
MGGAAGAPSQNRENHRRGSPLCTPANQTDRISVEQFMKARMIEKDRKYISDFRATALREWQTTQP